MRPRPAVELTDEHIFWEGLKHFRCDFWSGLTMIYGEKSSFLSLFTKALPTDGWTDGRMDGRTDTASFRDARMYLKMHSRVSIQERKRAQPSDRLWPWRNRLMQKTPFRVEDVGLETPNFTCTFPQRSSTLRPQFQLNWISRSRATAVQKRKTITTSCLWWNKYPLAVELTDKRIIWAGFIVSFEVVLL